MKLLQLWLVLCPEFGIHGLERRRQGSNCGNVCILSAFLWPSSFPFLSSVRLFSFLRFLSSFRIFSSLPTRSIRLCLPRPLHRRNRPLHRPTVDLPDGNPRPMIRSLVQSNKKIIQHIIELLNKKERKILSLIAALTKHDINDLTSNVNVQSSF